MKTAFRLTRALGFFYSATGVLRTRSSTDRTVLGSADQGVSSILSVDSGAETAAALAQRGYTLVQAHHVFVETSTDLTCSILTTSSGTPNRMAIYMKANKIVIAATLGCNGQVTYATLNLDGTAAAWTQSTTAPA